MYKKMDSGYFASSTYKITTLYSSYNITYILTPAGNKTKDTKMRFCSKNKDYFKSYSDVYFI